MNATRVCPRCDGECPADEDGGLCPACLLAMVLNAQEGDGPTGETIEEMAYADHGLELLGRIAEGGMGVIYEARQVDLDRRVAFKILREDCRDVAGVREHFVEEARVGGGLEHPGIVPIYESGEIGDRPFFTMRLIEGRTLADALARGADRGRSLDDFRRVCEAVAYAHARGVVHRDLKPGNIMLGAFGEALIVDWGLAKTLDAESFESTTAAVTGTPAYMSPEQANGDADRQDRRCDVFGLGAILCEILTGRPPYVGETEDEVRKKARAGETADALRRIESCGADAELRRLAASCLAVDPDRRPRDAGAVAEAIVAYQTSVQARLKHEAEARWRAEVRAGEERKRWGLFSLLVLVCAATGLWWVTERGARARREAETARSLSTAIDEAGRLHTQGRSAEARAAARKVEGLLGSVSESDRPRFAAKLADLEMLNRLEDARYLPAQAAPGRLLHVQAADAYAEAFRSYGIDVDNAGAAEARIRSSAIRGELVAAMDDWARTTVTPSRRAQIRRVAEAADPDQGGFASRLRQALAKPGRADLGELASTVHVDSHPAAQLASLGAALRARGALDEAVSLMNAAQVRYPDDFWINLELACALTARSAGDAADAKAAMSAALALSRRNPGAYFYLGSALHDLGRLGPAIDAYKQAIALRPEYPEAYCNLGNALTAQGKIDEAVAAFRTAIATRKGYALAYFNLGYALDEKERYEEAAEAYREAIRARPEYAEALCNLGLAEYRLGRFSQALPDLTRGIELLPETEPLRPYWKSVAEMARSLAELEPRLESVLNGAEPPKDAKSLVGLARLCAWRNRALYLRATRLYQAAFAAEPKLAEDLVVGDRFAAAESAAMAGCGRGADAGATSESERAELRTLALGWLRADLALRSRQIASGDARPREDARMRLRYWTRDANFEAVRTPDAIELLPESERAGWKALWAEVAERIGTASKTK